MLDNYIKQQPIIHRILKNSLKNNRNVHAYLFETSDKENGLKVALAFSKYLLCPKNYSNDDHCGECNQCKVIDNNNFTEIKIINPDGMWIKKEQLTALQQEFSKKAIGSTKKVYIINSAEKLNPQAANSILKFLEEPEDNIVAILITNNQYQLLDTIVSRCQILSFIENKNIDSDNLLECLWKNVIMTDEEKEVFNSERIDSVINFVDFYENNGIDTLLYLNRLWHKNINKRRLIEIAFEVMILFYKDILNYKCNRNVEIFNEYQKQIESIAVKNTSPIICDKIKKILEIKEKISYNMNSNLLMDKLIIMLEGGV